MKAAPHILVAIPPPTGDVGTECACVQRSNLGEEEQLRDIPNVPKTSRTVGRLQIGPYLYASFPMDVFKTTTTSEECHHFGVSQCLYPPKMDAKNDPPASMRTEISVRSVQQKLRLSPHGCSLGASCETFEVMDLIRR